MIVNLWRVGGVAAASLLLAAQTGPTPELSCTHHDGPHGRLAYDVHIVFFDHDSAEITPRAVTSLAYVAEIYRPLGHCRLVVAAHTDSAGSAAYNLRLSERRARAVVAQLRRLGVRAPALLEPFGETRPALETPDGVVEPQNRRAEVLIAPRDRR